MGTGILKGIRVVELSMGWAGPMIGMLLGDFGAEVIKIESRGHLDWWRASTKRPQSHEPPYELSPVFNTVNRNKYDITLELTEPRCARLFKDLVRISDIVLESFTPRVMKNLGLGYPVLKELNPTLIMVSLPAFGLSGPLRDYAGVGMTADCMAGLASITGYEGGGPRLQPNAYGDPVSGINGAIAVMMAIRHRYMTGEGQHIEVAHVETVLHHMAAPLMDYVMNGRIWPRRGNQDPVFAPHGCYRCLGQDEWVTIVVRSDIEWQALCKLMERPDLAQDPRFTDTLSRWRHRKTLDKIVEEWTLLRDKREVMETLQRAGVAAGAVLSNKEVLEDPHLEARGFFRPLDRKHIGRHSYPGFVPRLSRDAGSTFKSAPCLGEDNNLILEDLLGATKDEVAFLETEGVIGSTPLL